MSITADRALEAPQILVSWDFPRVLPDIERITLVRSTYHYPESQSDGDSLLSETQDMANLRTHFADLTAEADNVYYYGLFFDHKGPYALSQSFSQDVERLGSMRSVEIKTNYHNNSVGIGTGVDASFAGSLASLVKPTTFRLEAPVGSVMQYLVDDGAGVLVGDGFGVIDYATGAFSATFTAGNVDVGEDLTGTAEAGGDNYWILTKDDLNETVLWAYDRLKELAYSRITLDNLLETGEVVKSITRIAPTSSDYVIELVTDRRYLNILVANTAESAELDDVVLEWTLQGKLTAGYQVAGSVHEFTSNIGAAPTDAGIRILDSHNKEAVLLDNLGTVVSTMDLSGLEYPEYRGIRYEMPTSGVTNILIGADKTILSIDDAVTTVGIGDLNALYPVREVIYDFAFIDQRIATINDNYSIIERYILDRVRYFQIEEAAHAFATGGLWHFDVEGESSGLGGAFTVDAGAPTFDHAGKFSTCMQLETEADALSATISTPADEGMVGFWWKSPYTGYKPTSTVAYGDLITLKHSGEVLRVSFESSGDLTAITDGFNSVTWQDALDELDDGIFHHILVRWQVGGDLELYVDGELKASGAQPVGLSGTLTTVYAGYAGAGSSVSALGYVDDLVVTGWYDLFPRYVVKTLGNRAHAISGRDPSAVPVNFRDSFKGNFSEFVLKNDYQQVLLPANKELDTGEVIFRQGNDDLILGHLGALSRLLGLMVDRVVDYREWFMNHLKVSQVEDEFIKELGYLINAVDFDTDWNVEKKRDHLMVMWKCFQDGGSLLSFKRLIRHLGFSLYLDESGDIPYIVYRRQFDSVVDPDRPDTPFDTSIFDSDDDEVALVKLFLGFFKESLVGETGGTSSTAARTFTDTSSLFLAFAEPGSKLFIHDVDAPEDNGEYLIQSVPTLFTMTVDRDWPVGNLADLSYKLYWRVPDVDPYVNKLINRLSTIKARWQEFATGL